MEISPMNFVDAQGSSTIRTFKEAVSNVTILYSLHSSGKDWAAFQDTVIATASTTHQDRPIVISVSGPWGQLEKIRSEALAVIEELKTYGINVSSFATAQGLEELSTNEHATALEGIQNTMAVYIASEYNSSGFEFDFEGAKYIARLVDDLYRNTLSSPEDCEALKGFVADLLGETDQAIVAMFAHYGGSIGEHYEGLLWAAMIGAAWGEFAKSPSTESFEAWKTCLLKTLIAPKDPALYWKPDTAKIPAYSEYVNAAWETLTRK